MESIPGNIATTAEMLRKRVRLCERDNGALPGPATVALIEPISYTPSVEVEANYGRRQTKASTTSFTPYPALQQV